MNNIEENKKPKEPEKLWEKSVKISKEKDKIVVPPIQIQKPKSSSPSKQWSDQSERSSVVDTPAIEIKN